MNSTTLLVGVLLVGGFVLYTQSQKSGGSGGSSPASPAAAAPGFGFNLGFFKND